MPAWLVRGDEPIPGRSSCTASTTAPQTGLRLVPALHRAGLPTLLITYREDLGAPASPDGLHHMGQTEWRDLEAAVRYALAHGARRIVLAGYSMGGSIVAQFMQNSELAPRVAGLVLDAPALDWQEILSFNATEMGLPAFSTLPVEWAIGARIDVDWDNLDAVRHPRTSSSRSCSSTAPRRGPDPISDEFAELPRQVTYYESSTPATRAWNLDAEALRPATSSHTRATAPASPTLPSPPIAGHTEAWNVNPKLYERRLAMFLSRMELRGFEPLASAVPRRRSAS